MLQHEAKAKTGMERERDEDTGRDGRYALLTASVGPIIWQGTTTRSRPWVEVAITNHVS